MEPSSQPMNDQRRVSKKRNRQPVSCGHCRMRKLKCNRAKPCESCVKAGDAATCSYNSNRLIPREVHFSSDQPPREELINRIDRLEQLVFSAMSNQPQPALPAAEIPQSNIELSGGESTGLERTNEAHKIESDPEIDELSTAFGVMKVDCDKTIYLGGAHWVSIMSEIKEFRNYLDYNHEGLEHDALENRASTKGPGKESSLLLGTSPPKTREELLSYMPTRPIADQLVTRCFDHYSCLLPIVHEPTFRKQFDEHWNDPTKTKIIWLSLLFGMFRLAALSYEGTEDEISAWDLGTSDEYKVRAIDCLVAGDYTNPADHTIEALLLYVQAEWMASEDATIDLSVIIGMMVRLAMRMGIHRDSKAHPGLTIFQGEMRRRVWAQLRVMDTLYSFQLSLPASVRSDECDCELPRNIWNKDFDEDTVALLPARPLTENTEVCYIIMKTRLLLLFGRILALTESSDTISTETVIKYEQELYEIRKDMPSHFRVPSPGELTTTSLSLKKTQINLDRIYQSAQCILYRKFLRRISSNFRYRGACIDAAMTLLNHQATLFLECDSLYPENIKQRHRLAFTTHDFFIACMAIALDLHYGFESEPTIPSATDIALWGYDRRYEMITALETSTEFWRGSREGSVEAAKAYGMFSFVLQKVKKAQRTTGTPFGSNQDILEAVINYEAAPLDAPVGMKEAAGLPTDFDWDLWNSWKGDSEGFESLMQWKPL